MKQFSQETRERMRIASQLRWNGARGQQAREHISRMLVAKLDLEKVRSLYQQGKALKAIGAEFGVRADAVMRFMEKHKIPRRKRWEAGRLCGPQHPNWKGSEASCKSLHMRLRRQRGTPQHCTVCGTSDPNKWYDWANLTGKYDDFDDYKRMCRQCHRAYDKARRIAA